MAAFQEIRRDRAGCPRQLRRRLWQARRYSRCHRPEQSKPSHTYISIFILFFIFFNV